MCIYRYTVCFFRLFQHPLRLNVPMNKHPDEANEANCTGPRAHGFLKMVHQQ